MHLYWLLVLNCNLSLFFFFFFFLPLKVLNSHVLMMSLTGCENAQLVSALDSEDTGTLNFLNGLYTLPTEMVKAGFGNNGAFNVGDIGKKIPDVGTGAVLGSEECLKRCGIQVP
jgi:hypothetical protein